MQRCVITVIGVGVMALLLTSGAQATSHGKGFIGLWQGVGDGGVVLTADISDIDGDQQFRIRINIQGFAALCNALNEEGVPIELGHLVATPTEGTINEDGDLIFTESLTCGITGRIIAPNIETTFSLINKNTILDVTPGIPLHRISPPLHKGR